MSAPAEVHLRDLARGVLRILPDTLETARGLWNLARVSADKPASIGLQLEQVAQRDPGRLALLFDERSWTYAEFNAWANRIAAVYRARGVKSGDTVAILMENRPEVLACVAAAVKLGAVAAMLVLLPWGLLATYVALGLTAAGVAATFIIEVPEFLGVVRGGPMPHGAAFISDGGPPRAQ